MDTVEAVIKETESAFNAGDAAALAATFTPEAWSVGVTGQVLHGQDEILEVGRQLFAGALQGQRARYVIDEVRELAPGVAIVRKLAYATDADGNDVDLDHTMVALYVLVEGEDGWRVAARQNTLVQR